MKKKILAFLLVMTMVFGLVGCGSSEKSASLVDRQKDLQDVKSGEFTMELNMKMNLSDASAADPTSGMMNEILKKGINVKFEGVSESQTKADVNISYNLGDGKYVDVTQLIVDKDTVYINMKKVKDFVAGIKELAQYASFVPADKEYLKISKSDVEKYMKASGVTATATVPSTDSMESYKLLGIQICQYIDDAAKDVKPAVLKDEDGKLVISINDKNVKAFIDSAKKLDVEKYFDNYIKEADKLKGDKTFVEQVKSKKDSFITEYKKGLKEASEQLAKDHSKAKFNLEMDLNTTGKKGSYKVDENIKFTAKDDKDDIQIGGKYTINEKTEKKVEVPSDATTLDEFIATIQSLLGSFQGTGTK